jgi:hypothetical protein
VARLNEKRLTMWIRRAGVIGFLFFLAKGLVWLAAAGVVARWLR